MFRENSNRLRLFLAEFLVCLAMLICFTSCEECFVSNSSIGPSFFPVVSIETSDGKPVTNKEIYLNAYVSITHADSINDLFDSIMIKGRGNSTWSAPKKPYALKFYRKRAVLSLPENKSWILLANYYDKTLLRNTVGFFLGGMSLLDYTTRFYNVNLYINKEYRGIYQLGEKIKVGKDRLNIGDDGFILEVDWKYNKDEVLFRTQHLKHPINIKSPEVVYNDSSYLYVKDYVNKAESALYADNFTDLDEGYRKYMDIYSFVEYYVIHEIAKSIDAPFYTSCYMNMSRNGKLKMGPVWDFDLSFGNSGSAGGKTFDNPQGFYIKNQYWYIRLFEDPSFVDLVKTRFNDYYEGRQAIYDMIDSESAIIKKHILEDNKLWGRLCSKNSSEETVQQAYQKEVDALKDWIETRFIWLHAQINGL